ncbi:beta-ketoacyl-[acyl-carrier-protein] synthase family protein [Paenibacillus sp. NPDC055715]
MRRVAITGVGVISPLGTDKKTFWNNLKSGNSKAKTLRDVTSSELFGNHPFVSQVIMEVDDFNPDNYRIPPHVKKMDRYIQFAVAAAEMAKEDANLDRVPPDKLGISLSTAICGTRKMEEQFVKVTNYGVNPINPQMVASDLYMASMSNTPATIIAGLIHAEGPCVTLSTGCIGGMDAIGYAFEAIRYGDMDVMIAGASEAPITPITIASFEIINCLSTKHNDEPIKASRPFDKQRDGFVLGEGCGILVLEEWERAVDRGAKIYGEITGFSNTSNGLHMTDLASDGIDLTRAITLALEDANIRPNQVDYVSAHGSSTPQNDRCETSAIHEALQTHARNVPVNSAKSVQGHPLSAASAIELIACCLSLENHEVHPTINQDFADPECDLDYVSDQSRHWDGEVILKTASGFSGLHSAMILQKTTKGSQT